MFRDEGVVDGGPVDDVKQLDEEVFPVLEVGIDPRSDEF